MLVDFPVVPPVLVYNISINFDLLLFLRVWQASKPTRARIKDQLGTRHSSVGPFQLEHFFFFFITTILQVLYSWVILHRTNKINKSYVIRNITHNVLCIIRFFFERVRRKIISLIETGPGTVRPSIRASIRVSIQTKNYYFCPSSFEKKKKRVSLFYRHKTRWKLIWKLITRRLVV